MKKFKDRQGSDVYLRCLSGIEEFYQTVWKGYQSNSASIATLELEQGSPEVIMKKFLRFLYAQYQAKYTELTGALIDAVNQKEYVIFGLVGRSLIETTAVFRYYNIKLRVVIDRVVNEGHITPETMRELIDLLDRHLRGGRFNWHEFHMGDRNEFAKRLVEARKKKPPSDLGNFDKTNPDQVNVLTTIDQWAKEESYILVIYEFFCEMVHPNLGSNFMVMGTRAGKLVVGKSSKKDVGEKLCREGLQMLAASAIREGASNMATLVLLKEPD